MSTTSEKLPLIMLADWVPGPKQGEWTYNDYKALPDDGKRYEIVNGVLLLMPSPSRSHQKTIGEIATHLRTHIQTTGLGEVYVALFDVELASNIVFQPNVLVVLKANLYKVTEGGVIGAPDLVVEVISPTSGPYDRITKYEKYSQAKVPEYWLVNPEQHTVEVLVLEASEYRSLGIFEGQATLPSRVVSGLPASVEQFFAAS